MGSLSPSRSGPPVFGFGLLDAVSDDEILSYQGRQGFKRHSAVVGVAHWGVELEGLARARLDGSARRIAALSDKTIYPWSDLLLHDLGVENDDRRQMGAASGRMWRTTPLWGMRHKAHMWHDGSITTAEEAISAHGGEAAPSRRAYEALAKRHKEALQAFLQSL